MSQVKRIVRQSHRKSTQGCQTCKRRHFKCDELRPICKRCADSKQECVYLVKDDTLRGDIGVELRWPDVIEQACTEWKRSGRPPFRRLALTGPPSWHNMPMADLRYIYHMALVDTMLDVSGTSNMCLLWGEIRVMIQLATSFECVAHTLAATSAERLAVLTKSQEAFTDAVRYRTLALSGLSREIQTFSEHNADAILSSYLGCLFIMADYREVMIITKSIASVAARMQSWSEQSAFRNLFNHDRQRLITGVQCSEPEPFPQRPTQDIPNLIMNGVNALNRLSHCLRHDLNLAAVIRQLRDVMRIVHDQLSTEISAPTQYRLIYPFISWYNRNSASSYVAISEKDPTVLVFLLHMYSALLSLALAMPATNLPLFTAFRFRAILEISAAIEQKQGVQCPGCSIFHKFSEIVAFAQNAVQVYGHDMPV